MICVDIKAPGTMSPCCIAQTELRGAHFEGSKTQRGAD